MSFGFCQCSRIMGEMTNVVELRGFEPLAFSLRTRRATNCATAPCVNRKGTKAPHPANNGLLA